MFLWHLHRIQLEGLDYSPNHSKYIVFRRGSGVHGHIDVPWVRWMSFVCWCARRSSHLWESTWVQFYDCWSLLYHISRYVFLYQHCYRNTYGDNNDFWIEKKYLKNSNSSYAPILACVLIYLIFARQTKGFLRRNVGSKNGISNRYVNAN